jgi:hypothetical protein
VFRVKQARLEGTGSPSTNSLETASQDATRSTSGWRSAKRKWHDAMFRVKQARLEGTGSPSTNSLETASQDATLRTSGRRPAKRKPVRSRCFA